MERGCDVLALELRVGGMPVQGRLAVALDEPDDLLVVPDVVHGEAHRHDTVDVRQDEEAEREHLLEDPPACP